MARTLYVAIRQSGTSALTFDALNELPEPAYPGSRYAKHYNTVWQIDGVDSPTQGVAAILALSANQPVGLDTTVTRIYPPEPTTDERLEAARSVLRADYWDDVRGVCDDVRSAIESRELTDTEAVDEYINQTVDGHGRVIYTGQAIEGLRYTDNEDAYVEEYGGAPLDESGDINWSTLMYAAFRADIVSTLGDIDDLLEAAAPDRCEDCDEPLPDDRDPDDDKCPDCRADADDEDEGK